MPLSVGQTLSHYEILGPIGAGGMGEVYRARDQRLDREVALKVLPRELAGDDERLHRFEREAKALASLNHPNVAQVFGIDRVDDTSFIAMELVPGRDLAAHLSDGPLSQAEAVAVCRQIADGIEAAHEAGVIHRDLKPGNVVLTPDGRVKVLDFGLAKPARAEGEAGASTADNALTTEVGRLLGTPTYMAPEQARGLPVDRRVDVWAFGCVLYACLTGRRAFDGDTISDVLASILEREPDWSALPASTSPRLRELLERCLRKDVRLRLRDAGEARIQLEELAAGTLEAAPGPGPAPAAGPRLLALGLVTVVSLGLALWFGLNGGSEANSARGLELVSNLTNTPWWTGAVNWSPHGESIVYADITPRGMGIFVKPVPGGSANPVVDEPGDASVARFSPDGATLAYISSWPPGSPLKLIDSQGKEAPRTLLMTGIHTLDVTTQAQALGDRPWLPSGSELLVTLPGAEGRLAIHRVDVRSGEPRQLTFPGPGEADFSASLSFDAERVVFSRRTVRGEELWLLPAAGGEPTPLLRDQLACYTPAWRPDNRHVVFCRSTRGGYYHLWEIEVETRALRQITYETRRAWTVSVAGDDRLLFCSSDHDTFLHRVARDGDSPPLLVNAHGSDNFGARPSPVDDRIAYHSNRTGNPEIWLLDPGVGLETRLTDNSAEDVFADWSPDGRELLFVSNEGGAFGLHILDVERRTRRELDIGRSLSLFGSNLTNASPIARWSPDPTDARISFIVSEGSDSTLWTVRPDGGELREALSDVYGFDWYLDSRRGLVTRVRDDFQTELLAVHLETGATRLLATLAHTEIEVAPDGTAVSFVSGQGHVGMNLFVLPLTPPQDEDGLPTPDGEPVQRTDGAGRWHPHNGGWTRDSRELVFTHDRDFGDAYEVIERP